MGSLPLHQAGVGSAVNDTSREVGGALGVAIVGSMLSSLYSTDLNAKLPANVPGQVRDAADQSVGAALQVSAQLGRGRRPARRRGARVVRLRDVAGVARHRGGGAGGRAPRLAVPAGSRRPRHRPRRRTSRSSGWSRRSRTRSWRGRADSGTSGRFRSAVPPSGHGSASSPTPRVDSAPPSRPPGTAPLHLRHLGSMRYAVRSTGHGSASLQPARRGQWGTTGRCRRGRSSHPGSWPGTAGGSPRRRRRSRRVGSRW